MAAPPPDSPWRARLRAELGALLWEPPAGARTPRSAQDLIGRLGFLAVGVGLLPLVYGASMEVTAPVAEAFPPIIAGATLMVAGVLMLLAARPGPPFPFAVFEGGIFVASSMMSAPGIQEVRGARFIAWAQATRLEDMRGPEGRAVLVWMGTGEAGLASLAPDAALDEKERDAVFDALLAAVDKASGGRLKATQAAADEGSEEP